MKYRLMTLALIVIIIAGCASSMHEMRVALGTNFAPAGKSFSSQIEVGANESAIYIYRNIGYGYAPEVILNGINLQLLGEGGFFVEKVAPGFAEVLVQANPSRGNWNFKPIGIRVKVAPGQRRYIRIGAGIGGVLATPWVGGLSYQAEIREVPEHVAVQELSKLKAMR